MSRCTVLLLLLNPRFTGTTFRVYKGYASHAPQIPTSFLQVGYRKSSPMPHGVKKQSVFNKIRIYIDTKTGQIYEGIQTNIGPSNGIIMSFVAEDMQMYLGLCNLWPVRWTSAIENDLHHLQLIYGDLRNIITSYVDV
jgi:hypothetical protein